MKRSVLFLFRAFLSHTGYVSGCILMSFLLFSCAGSKKIVESTNQAGIYNPGIISLHPDYLIFHQTDSVSVLQIRLLTDELLFNEANAEHTLQSMVKIKYILWDSSEINKKALIADSATIIRRLTNTPNKKALSLSIPIHAASGKKYKLQIMVMDMLHAISQKNYITLNKQNQYSGQNFKISLSGESNLFHAYFSPVDTLSIQYRFYPQKIFVRFQKDRSNVASAPSALETPTPFTFKADSTWEYDYTAMPKLNYPMKGLYLIQTDTMHQEGFLVSNFGRNFPRIKEPELMLPPLQYLLDATEYQTLAKTSNVKLAVDNYWLKLTSNTNQARELIRIFYTRQTYANYFFSDYTEGWKTDRGMIYIILGPADYIKKTADSEIWSYGTENNNPFFRIVFKKKDNPYCETHFELQRTDNYATIWKAAINSWRKGKVFVFNED